MFRINKRRKKSSIFIVVVLSILFGGLITEGCSIIKPSKEELTKEALRIKYNEEFVVHEINTTSYGGGRFQATVSPINNPEVLFDIDMIDDGRSMGDDYIQRYTAKLMNDILKEDLKQFFSDAFIRSEVKFNTIDESQEFRNCDLQEITGNAENGELDLEIYVNKKVGSTKEFEKEYDYFSKGIEKYEKEGKMFPVTVSIIFVDRDTEERVREYFKHDLDYDSRYYEKALGVEKFELWEEEKGVIDIGNPPNISACFDKKYSYIESKERYIMLRGELEK